MTEEPSAHLARQTPGVYIAELPAFPTSVVGVGTALPVFIGYTEFAGDENGKPLYLEPMRLDSLAGFEIIFGGPFLGRTAEHPFNLHLSMQLFFANGGGACWVISVGSYWENRFPVRAEAESKHWRLGRIVAGEPSDPATAHSLVGGIKAAAPLTGPTMIVAPEACALTDNDNVGYNVVVQTMLSQAATLQDRMAILDLPGCLNATRTTGPNGLLAGQKALATALSAPGLNLSYGAAYAPALKTKIGGKERIVPPSAVMAGVWARNDDESGVWRAPANIALEDVSATLCPMVEADQAEFDAPANGHAINLLRDFAEEGTLLVWGARTLDANSADFRFIAVRRTLTFVEQSIKTALMSFVFASNDATTWASLTALISNFLTSLWKSGGLQGAKPENAFSVNCGLGSTMTADDILNGYLILAVTVALVRPAEFIALTFTQTMQRA